MRRAFSWGLPLYAAVVTGVFVGKGLPDNNLRAEGDRARTDSGKATTATPTSSPPAPATGDAGSYPIPAPPAQPKHLFHLIIRYEGDGLPDQDLLAAALAAAGQGGDEKPKKAAQSKTVQAKDTFQVIIRYEGDGIIDDNVANVLKDYFAAEKAAGALAPVQDSQKGPPGRYHARPPVDPYPSENAPPPVDPEQSENAPPDPTPAPRNVSPTPRCPAPAPRSSAPTIRVKRVSGPVE